MDQTDEMMNRRQTADKAAYVAALLNRPMPPQNDFASMYAGAAMPIERMNSDSLAQPNGVQDFSKMLDGLVTTGMWKRHQGSFPPALHPDHYDFTNK